MPMQKFSTLIYCIKSFKSDSEPITFDSLDFDTTEATPMHSPSDASVKNILNFARSYDVIETKTTGHVEMILN